MSFEQISDIIQTTAQEHETCGTPFTLRQLQACCQAFLRLQDLTQDPLRTLAMFDELVDHALAREDPWEWVVAELRFEAQVVALGNRTEAAQSGLRYRPYLSDALLDLYNERVRRFAHFTTPAH